MINPDEHFAKGSSGHEMTSQAVAEIDRARKAGLTAEADRLESNLNASIITLRKSGGKDVNGFNTMIKSIGELGPQIESVNKSRADAEKTASGISTTLGTAYALGVNVDPTIKDGITRALELGDSPRVKVFDDTLQALIKIKTEEKPVSTSKNEELQLNPFEQQRLYGLAAINLQKQGVTGTPEELQKAISSELSDPAKYKQLAQEVKKREMVETQARKIYRRLEAARELYSNAELMNEFGDTKPTQWAQTLFTTGDNALHAALLNQLKGGDLSQGMQEIKEATGTAAGMALEETKALANSISALEKDLAPEDAKKKVLQVINDAKFALERLGVDPELIQSKGRFKESPGQRVLGNKEKFLLPDERQFYGIMGSSPSVKSSEAETQEYNTFFDSFPSIPNYPTK
jgi:hypothetical protein